MSWNRNRYARLGPNNEVVPCSMDEWGEMFQDHKRRQIGYEEISDFRTGKLMYLVSTVFLGMDHSITGVHPEWFETMVFAYVVGDSSRSRAEDWVERTTTYEEAMSIHEKMVNAYREIALKRLSGENIEQKAN